MLLKERKGERKKVGDFYTTLSDGVESHQAPFYR
jgi:hypothetical protein